MTHRNGNVYEGIFDNGRKNGFGRMTYANGDLYIGSWIDNKRDGLGRQIYAATGDIFEGEFMGDS